MNECGKSGGFVAYESTMSESGGSIVNIISDYFRGFPFMA